eukprot:GEMP01062845.1.p1 GENE.GEMP01062845.1~~GEMP01062845.1.p1  ORF type:complete len:337 (+),score=67.03 GEMP01062845.1:61-1071(+)
MLVLGASQPLFDEPDATSQWFVEAVRPKEAEKAPVVILFTGSGWVNFAPGTPFGTLVRMTQQNVIKAFLKRNYSVVSIYGGVHPLQTPLFDLLWIIYFVLSCVVELNVVWGSALTCMLFILMTAASKAELRILPLSFVGPLFGPHAAYAAVALLPILSRGSLWMQGWRPRRLNYLEVGDRAVARTKKSCDILNADPDRIIVVGYSSGAHIAASYCLSRDDAPRDVVLLSGIYDVAVPFNPILPVYVFLYVFMTLVFGRHGWRECPQYLLDSGTYTARVGRYRWFILTCENELFGLPFERTMFRPVPFITSLVKAGSDKTAEADFVRTMEVPGNLDM